MIERLKSLQNQYEWPTILLKELANFNYPQLLNFYQSDIRWFDYQQGIYEINNKKEIKAYEIQESLFTNSYHTSFDVKQSVSSSKNSQHLKEMLNETNIMNDEFYHIIEEKQLGTGEILQPNHKSSNNFNNQLKMRNPSMQSVFHNNTLVQPNLFDNMQKINGEMSPNNNSENNSDNSDYKQEMKTFQMKKCLFHYKGITEKIEKHLSEEKNIFCIMKNRFICLFCKKHHYYYKNADIKATSKQIFKELKIFINFFQETLNCFYKLNEYKNVLNYFLFTKENLLNFVTSLIFNSQEISDLIFSINQLLNKDDEVLLEAQYENAKEFLPADFEVSHKYCLNEKTIQYIYEKKSLISVEKTNYTSTALPDKTIFTQSSKTLSDLKRFSTKTFDFEDETQKIKIKLKEKKPFEKAIRRLRRITQNTSPLHKLKTILQTSENLFQEIRNFYGCFDMQLNERLGGDEILGLFVYIVAQAKIPDLLSHCAMIKLFLTSNLTNSISGYYLVTIQVALNYLLSMKIDKKSRTFSSMKEFHQFVKVVNEKTI